MRYAIISDIHANLEALKAFLKKIEKLDIDEIVCLGDIVGYNPNPEECVELVRKMHIRCILGNHDSRVAGLADPRDFNALAEDAVYWTRENLSHQSIDFLRKLPRKLIINEDFIAVHGWVNDTDRYIFGAMDATRNFNLMKISGSVNVCFFGHTHVAVAYIENSKKVTVSGEHEVFIEDENNYLINPGGLGQPRDRDPRAPYAVYDTGTSVVTFERVEYDYEKTARKIKKVGLPLQLAERLKLGW